ncbi:MAG: beta-N-acetylhexosaminidase [Vicinamibacterales bacterium]
MMRVLAAVVAGSVLIAGCAKKPAVTLPPAVRTTFNSSFVDIIPLPRTVEPHAGAGFTITADTVVAVSPGDDRSAWIAHYLSDLIGLAAAPQSPHVDMSGGPIPPGAISLELGGAADTGVEGYELSVAPDRVTIRASQPAGLFYGVQSFRQLLPAFVEYEGVRPDKTRPVTAAPGRIIDAPRFAWRGAMLDVSRHFLPVDDVKRFVALMSLYKLNRLHLHLADDQGWRIEIASWPNLAVQGGRTQVGGGAGGFYTQQQYADLVRYAAERFVTIVPEIDMPGHTNAALAAYGELNCDGVAREPYTGVQVGFSALCVDKEITYTFIDDVVREIAGLTTGAWFHIGGDEVKTLTDEQYLRFIERVQTIVQSHGKQMIGWDEIAPAPFLNTSVVQHWRPKTTPAAAVAKGIRIIMSVANKAYLDMKYDGTTAIGQSWAGYVDVETAYDWDPASMAAGVPESALLGVEAPLWSETLVTIRDVEFLAFPRLAGISEVGWSRADARDWNAFKVRLAAHGPRLTALGVNFYRSPQVPWKH